MSSKTDQLRAMREARWAIRQQVLVRPGARPRMPGPVLPSGPSPMQASPPERTSPVIGFAPAPTTAVPGRPPLEAGKAIGSYPAADLQALVSWLAGQGRAGTLEEAIDNVMAELGFQRRGKVIRARVEEAWHELQLPRDGDGVTSTGVEAAPSGQWKSCRPTG